MYLLFFYEFRLNRNRNRDSSSGHKCYKMYNGNKVDNKFKTHLYIFFVYFHVGRPAHSYHKLTVNKATGKRDGNIDGALICVYLTVLTCHSDRYKPCEKRKNDDTTAE